MLIKLGSRVFSCGPHTNIQDSKSVVHYTSVVQACPGSRLEQFPGSSACRLLWLNMTGRVVQQTVSPLPLCKPAALATVGRGAARLWRDGSATATCCYTDGCNAGPGRAAVSRDAANGPATRAELAAVLRRGQYMAGGSTTTTTPQPVTQAGPRGRADLPDSALRAAAATRAGPVLLLAFCLADIVG